jgi:hypothetical protein
MVITGLFFPPLLVPYYFYYHNWKKYPSESTLKKMENLLWLSIILVFTEILLISFLLFQYGHNFVHVIGTFY